MAELQKLQFEKDDNGRPVYTAKDVAINLEKVGKIVESLS